MSVKVMSAIWEQSPQKANRLLALLAVGDSANDDGWAFPSQETIAFKCRVTKRAIQNTLDDLEAEQELVIYNRINPNNEGQHYSNCYHLPKYGRADAPAPAELRGQLRARSRGSVVDDVTQGGSVVQYVTPSVVDDATLAKPTTLPSVADYRGVAKPATPDPLLNHQTSSSQGLLKSAPGGAPTATEFGIQPTAINPDEWVPLDSLEDDANAEPDFYPCTGADINALIDAWWNWVPVRPTKRGKVIPAGSHYGNATIRDFAKTLVERGVLPADVALLLGEIRVDDDSRWAYLRSKELPFNYVGELLLEWVAADRAANWYTPDNPRITPRKPGKTLNLNRIIDSDHPLDDFANDPDFYVDVPRPFLSPQSVEDFGPDTGFSGTDAELLAELEIHP